MSRSTEKKYLPHLIYVLFPALLFTVSYEIVAAALSFLAAWISGENKAAASFLLHHPGDAAAISTAISIAAAFLTIWKIARREVSYTASFRNRIIPRKEEKTNAGTEEKSDGREGKNTKREGKGIWPDRNRGMESVTGGAAEKTGVCWQDPDTLTVIMAAAGCILLSLFLNAVLASFGFVQADAGADAASRQTGIVSLPFGFLVYGILTPFCEETVFRGITFQRACFGWSIRNGILISSLLFGLYHGNVVQGFYAFCMGIVFCLFGLLCDRLWYVIVLHGTINAVTLAASQTGFYSILCTSAAWMAALAGGTVLCGGFVWFRLRRKSG